MQQYSEVINAVDYFLPTDDEWLANVVGLSVVEDKQERLELRRRAGRVLRERERASYLTKNHRRGLHMNFMLCDDPAYKEAVYFSPITQEEREEALGLAELSILTSIVHEAYHKSVEAGDYSDDVEIPWYHVDFSEVLKLKAPNYLMQLYRVGYPHPNKRSENITCLRYLTDPLVKIPTPTEEESRVMPYLCLTEEYRRLYRPRYIHVVLGSEGPMTKVTSRTNYCDYNIDVTTNETTQITDISITPLVRPAEVYNKVLIAMMFRQTYLSIKERLELTGLYRLTSYFDSDILRRAKGRHGFICTMEETIPCLTASLLYRKRSKKSETVWYMRPIAIKEFSFR